MAKRKAKKTPKQRNTVAWLALFTALLALSIALSAHPLMGKLASKMSENWPLLREEITRYRESRAEPEPTAVDHLEEAGDAVREGDEDTAQDQLADAIRRIRRQIREAEGSVRAELIEVREDVESIADSLEMGTRTARDLSRLAARVEELIPQADSEAEED